MFKKLLSILLVFTLLLSFAACGKKEAPGEENTDTPAEEEVVTNLGTINSLTGLDNLDKDKVNYRPVAIMIDNDSLAQKYAQAGVQTADIVYETEVEGGITRLMAVFADVSKAPQLGDIRSAREQFVQLATGHNAIYVHHGMDRHYCKPLMEKLGTDNFTVGTNNCGWRHTYGSAKSWQNLYTTGEKLANSLKDKNWKLTQNTVKSWQTFTNDAVTLSGGKADKVTVPFSGSSISYFKYDEESKNYIKTSRHAENKDNVNGGKYEFKNVFVLKTEMSYFPNNKHRKIDFSKGSGYYIVNGTYEKINWTKGDAKDSFVFTKEDGTPLTVQAGTSWVCIAKTSADIKFE